MKYKEISIDTCQIPLKKENFDLIREEIRYILDLKPYYIYSAGCINPMADMFMDVSVVVSQSMSSHLPNSDAHILLKTVSDNEKMTNDMSELYKQKIVYSKIQFFVDESYVTKSRKDLCLPEEKYLIGIVGNRLDSEMTKEFVMKVNLVLENNPTTAIVFIGFFSKCINYFEDYIEQGRVINLGYQKDLLSVYPTLNLYWNPPRLGGGISGLMALKAGIPVITHSDCDVYYHVGNEFACKEEEEMDLLSRYIYDKRFNEYMRRRSTMKYKKIENERYDNFKQMIIDIEHEVEEVKLI